MRKCLVPFTISYHIGNAGRIPPRAGAIPKPRFRNQVAEIRAGCRLPGPPAVLHFRRWPRNPLLSTALLSSGSDSSCASAASPSRVPRAHTPRPLHSWRRNARRSVLSGPFSSVSFCLCTRRRRFCIRGGIGREHASSFAFVFAHYCIALSVPPPSPQA